jgi:hypothetical protein
MSTAVPLSVLPTFVLLQMGGLPGFTGVVIATLLTAASLIAAYVWSVVLPLWHPTSSNGRR